MDPFALDGRSFDTDLLIFRSLFAIDPATNLPISTSYILATDGQGGLNWQSIFTNMSTMSGLEGSGIGYLPSSINQFSTQLLSISSIQGVGFSTLSTSIGLGGIPGSITGPQLYSTTAGIFESSIYISSGNLISTVNSLIGGNFSFPSELASTNIGLGTYGYVSSSRFTANINSLTSSVVQSTTSTITGLGTFGYISSLSLQSTVLGLGTFGYISSAALRSSVSSIYLTTASNITSSLTGLGTFGYVSTQTLLSSTDGLMRNINVDRAGNLIVYNANVTISSLQNLAFLSSFTNSSITYKGTNGPTIASTVGRDLFWSTANLQLNTHSNYLTPSTKITVDMYPTYLFCIMNLVNTTQVMELSTMIQYRNSIVPGSVTTSYMIANGFEAGYSNFYNTPIRLQLTAGTVASNYTESYVITHRLVNGLSSNLSGGLQNSNIQIYMPSTNSVFLTFQNQLM